MALDKMFVIDSEKCTGCRLCELACSFRHTGIFQPSSSRIKVRLFSREGYSVPVVCLQCEECPCIAVCQDEAIKRNEETGVIEIDDSKCIGCRDCLNACPHGAMSFDMALDKAIVCDLCDGDTECVKLCFPKAIEWVGADSAASVPGEKS